ncbi:microcin C transport system substrate-binding protein [Acinetobacter bereziniae]|uniref:extracellular solute-binding protein n=1 Tax=Acinetobacter bereziniae TaxID=106648 RepID=UPI001250ACAF|nr:extracellular solute-binding protein [Acinetobacter bereziniae]MDR6542897.1 microcin C transport system substrate-binding protein [Acinetobacter bereziniae]
MHLSFTHVSTFVLALGGGIAVDVAAAIQTTPYIAVHNSPLYVKAQVMPYANINAPKGGYISTSSIGTFDNLNSLNGKGSSTEGINYVFDSLMDSSLDEPGVLYPLLAEKVSYDPAKTKYVIFHLNPQARFSDGSPVTAEDIKFSFDTIQTKANLGFQMYLSDLAKTEVLSKYQVKMTFKSAHNPDMPYILAKIAIYSKADWKNKDYSKVTLQPILGSGPYLIERIDSGRSITYRRNPHYWAKDLPVNRGRYNFDRIKYVYYRSPEVAFEGFKSGQYTFYQEKSARNWVTAYHFPAVKAGLVKAYTAKIQTPALTQSLVFNTRKTPFNDLYFRQALTYAYDFEWINKALLYGQNIRLQSHFQNSGLAATGKPSVQELEILKPYLKQLPTLQREGVLADWQYPVSDATGFNRQNLLIARSILLKAGYRFYQGQLLDQQGKPIRIEFLIHQDGAQRTLLPYIRNLKKLGIQATIRQVDLPQYTERMRRLDFQMTPMDMPQSLTPGAEQAQMWGSKAADEIGNYNYAGIKNPVIDQLIQKMIASPNREQLVLHTRVLDRVLRAGYYQILTYGNDKNWYAYWNMYHQPVIKPKLSLGLEYWWADPIETKKVEQYLKR